MTIIPLTKRKSLNLFQGDDILRDLGHVLEILQAGRATLRKSIDHLAQIDTKLRGFGFERVTELPALIEVNRIANIQARYHYWSKFITANRYQAARQKAESADTFLARKKAFLVTAHETYLAPDSMHNDHRSIALLMDDLNAWTLSFGANQITAFAFGHWENRDVIYRCGLFGYSDQSLKYFTDYAKTGAVDPLSKVFQRSAQTQTASCPRSETACDGVRLANAITSISAGRAGVQSKVEQLRIDRMHDFQDFNSTETFPRFAVEYLHNNPVD